MRAQIESQVLVYILAVVVMAMVLIFGYKAIQDMKTQAETVELLRFRNDLSGAITSIAGRYGSSKVLELKCPAKFTKVCFVNLDYSDVKVEILNIKEPLIVNSVIDSVDPNLKFVKKNVFLCPRCTEQMYVGRIAISDKDGVDIAFRCFNQSHGELKLTVEGLGDGTRIY